jgi:hypothetical protein
MALVCIDVRQKLSVCFKIGSSDNASVCHQPGPYQKLVTLAANRGGDEVVRAVPFDAVELRLERLWG